MTRQQSQIQKGRWARRIGILGEWFAVLCLFLKGYRLLAWRLQTPYGEVDLLLSKGRDIVIVEVKYRKDILQHEYSISYHQYRRLCRAAQWLQSKNRHAASIRIDAFLLMPWRLPLHIRNLSQDTL